MFSSGPEVERILPELRLAETLRTVGDSTIEPDWEAMWEDLVDELVADLGSSSSLVVRLPRRGVGPRRARAAVAALAAALVLGVTSIGAAGAAPGSLLYPVRRAIERGALLVSVRDEGIHLRIAWAREGDLLEVLREGWFDLAPGLARDLMAARALAAGSGAGIEQLDVAIGRDVPPALAEAPFDVRRVVLQILGPLIPGGAVALPGGPSSLSNRAPDRILSGIEPLGSTPLEAEREDVADEREPGPDDERDQEGWAADSDDDDPEVGGDEDGDEQDGSEDGAQGGGEDEAQRGDDDADDRDADRDDDRDDGRDGDRDDDQDSREGRE